MLHFPLPTSLQQKTEESQHSHFTISYNWQKKGGCILHTLKMGLFPHIPLQSIRRQGAFIAFVPVDPGMRASSWCFFLPVQCLSTRSTLPEDDSEHETWQNKTHCNSLSWPSPTRNIDVLLLWAGMQSYLLHSQEQQQNSSPWCWHG